MRKEMANRALFLNYSMYVSLFSMSVYFPIFQRLVGELFPIIYWRALNLNLVSNYKFRGIYKNPEFRVPRTQGTNIDFVYTIYRTIYYILYTAGRMLLIWNIFHIFRDHIILV